MVDSRMFNLDEDITCEDVGKEVEVYLRSRNLITEGVKTPEGYFVQAKPKDDGWKKLSGTTLAIQVQMIQTGNKLTVNIGNGKWSDKIGAGLTGIIFAPVAAPLTVTAVFGAVNQKKLPGKIFEHIEKFLMSGGKSVIIAPLGHIGLKENEVFCPECKKVNKKGANFCEFCGASLTATCPECGSNVKLDSKFCPECGASMVIEEIETICPECGAVVEDGKKFCGECGASMVVEESETICPECGAVVEDGEKFCGECGASVIVEDVEIICDNCGAVVKDGKKFCSECGTKVESDGK